ncbi:MAG: SpoIIE family protein phosphatase [Eggerthellaceae bacterium]|nr:SpoIIE family protein phosphatase [Eggerthellaceae bacterium]
MAKGKPRISQAFQRWLLVLVALAFLATTACLWVIQGALAERNAVNLLEINLADVRQDINDASDENLLELAALVAADLDAAEAIDSALLSELARRYDVSEINCIGEDGAIFATTYPDFLGYDMASGAQSAEFMVLLEGRDRFVQSYQPVSYDASISRKYGGAALERGGFVQVGYDADRFQRDIDEFVVGVTRNRHVGEDGSVVIADESGCIVSDMHGSEGENLSAIGLAIDPAATPAGELFLAEAYGRPCHCMYQQTEGYLIVAAIPRSEATLSRNVSVGITTAMQILVFAALFAMVYVLVKRQVVSNIYQINDSLSAISDGQLDTVVDVRTHAEFDELSDDINATVDTLKRYIADAAARVDAELALAKAIQHSALPSTFPPYPNRDEFEIWAGMRTAKEVGGDFYDFYFIDDDTLALVVADVSGKGIPAAMFMMQAKTMLKSCAESVGDAAEALRRANERLCEGNEAGMFVTVWLGLLDVRTGRLEYANAGHNPPALMRADGRVELLNARPNFVLAGMEGVRYRRHELRLEPGDMLFLYTDGVTEAADEGNELFGEARMLAAFKAAARDSAGVREVCEAIGAEVDAFAGAVPQFDDITMLCLEYRPKGEVKCRVKELTLDASVSNIQVVTDFVNEELDAVRCPLKAQMQIDVAIDELFGNIAKYAYAPGEGKATVTVEFEGEPLAVSITFSDEGVPFDPLAKAEPDTSLPAEGREVGGLGILIVKRSMDEVSYERAGGRNVLRIRKVIGDAAAG